MELDPEFTGRLSEIVKILGGNRASGRIIEKSDRSIERYKKGFDAPFQDIFGLTQAAGVSLDWLATGVGERSANSMQSKRQACYQAMPLKAVAPEVVGHVVTALCKHQEKYGAMTPEEMGDAAAILCEWSADAGGFNQGILDRLMRFKNSV